MRNNPIIVALDVESAEKARAIVQALGEAASFYKVGLELYAAAGMDFVRELKSLGHGVFLDLKLYDIGETVMRSVMQIAREGVDFLTVHGMGQVMGAAVAGRADSKLKLLAVTVLTSVDDKDLRADGYSRSVTEIVDFRARRAMDAGIDGLICSALDVGRLRLLWPSGILATPGVRSPGAGAQDQKRVASPAEAIAGGADYVIIGRQITRAADPKAEIARVMEEVLA